MQDYKRSMMPATMLAMMLGGLAASGQRSCEPEPILHSAEPTYLKYEKPIESKRKQRKRLGKKGKRKTNLSKQNKIDFGGKQ